MSQAPGSLAKEGTAPAPETLEAWQGRQKWGWTVIILGSTYPAHGGGYAVV